MIPKEAIDAAARSMAETCSDNDLPWHNYLVDARMALEAAEPFMMGVQHATEAQLRESNAARQERIWALEAALIALRKGTALRGPIQLWEMYAREHQERMRLLERNRKLTSKLLRRARIVGALRSANRKMLVQIVGAGYRVPE